MYINTLVKMKIGIVIAGNIYLSPYVDNYIHILDSLNIAYEIISWNRDGVDSKIGFQFTERINNGLPRWKKISRYVRYIRFVKKTIKERQYDKLIIFGPHIAILISSFLAREYKNRYIFDYRDLSIEQYAFLRPSFKVVLSNSFANISSSPGFLEYLPKGYKFIISHNFDLDLYKSTKSKNYIEYKSNPISVLTIGLIRDFSTNSDLMRSLANKDNIEMSFVGNGFGVDALKQFAGEQGCRNVIFEGFYPKEKEKDYVINSTFLNIFLITRKTHSSTLSNRLYNALIYKRPMIVTSNSLHGDLVEEYNLGISIENCDNLADKLHNWLQNNDFTSFCERCDNLLDKFIAEQEVFIQEITNFVKS